MRWVIILLSVFFVLFSFTPTLIELYSRHFVPKERSFLLEHNYLFDYNFYLSRIRQGYEGRYLVSEKYYNQKHTPSLFQAFYLYLGKVGSLLGLTPVVVYHTSRLIFGLALLVGVGFYCTKVLPRWWGIVGFVFVLTAGSWPIPMMIAGALRFGTYMGWWSVVDSLQRITHLPHVLFGQLLLLWFVRVYSGAMKLGIKRIVWGLAGLVAGIIFPPTLVFIYTWFAVLLLLELLMILSHKNRKEGISVWIKHRIVPRILFVVLSFPSLLYVQYMVTQLPWSALPLMDIQHRLALPYREYALALGPMLPLGIAGLALVFIKMEKKLLPVLCWVATVGLLFVVFEQIPQQSPLRFTEAALHIPLGILAAYLFKTLWNIAGNRQNHPGGGRMDSPGVKDLKKIIVSLWRGTLVVSIAAIILLGISVMVSMIGWLNDQIVARRLGTWVVPIGAQIAYPLKDFMDAIYFTRDNIPRNSVVLTYITAGNYIPAYAGQFVYIGHINTPDEIVKEGIAKEFFEGKMSPTIANAFLQREHISYIFFGPQEREIGKRTELTTVYPYLTKVYENPQVILYRYK